MRNLGFKNSLPKQGYRLVNILNQDSPYKHLFCGQPELKNAISPVTGKPLLRFLSLDTTDPRLELETSKIKRIELLYSLTCRISWIDFFYKIIDDRIEILNLDVNFINSEEVYTDVPYEDYPIFFPGIRVDLIPVDENERDIVKEINETDNLELDLQYPELSEPYHQLGGEPYFVQKPDVLACPLCGKDMFFFASIGNNNGQAKGFFDNDYMQIIYQICKKCFVIAAYNRCD
jgi:predicted nucleic-acid-binding Zn-ribbon protein